MTRARRTRIEVVVEAAFRGEVCAVLEAEGASGWTVVRGAQGFGAHGVREEAGLSGVFENVIVLTVVGAERAERILARLEGVLADAHAVVLVSEVEVLRPGKF